MNKGKSPIGTASREKGGKKEKPSIEADIQDLLGRKLCETYNALVQEEVPPRFLELLEELKAKERKDEGGGG